MKPLTQIDLHVELQQTLTSLKVMCQSKLEKGHKQCQLYFKAIVQEITKLEEMLSEARGFNKACLQQINVLSEAIFYAKLDKAFRGCPVLFINDAYRDIASLVEQFAQICSKLKESKIIRKHRLLCRLAPKSSLAESVYHRVWRRRLLLPFLLVWDVCRYIANWIGGSFFMSRIILPALSVKDWRDEPFILFDDDIEEGFIQGIPSHYASHRYHLVMPKSTLSCVEMVHKDYDAKKHKTIVYCLGNRNIFPLQVCLDDIEALDEAGAPCRLVLWHYPGVYNSFGWPKRPADLANSGLYLIQSLLDDGVDAQSLILKGHSLGGYVATHMAYCCHRQRCLVKVWNDRSFSDAQNYILAKATIKEGSGYKVRSKILTGIIKLCYPLIWLFTRLFMCEMPSFFYFYSIGRHYSDYIVLRSREDQRQSNTVIDDMIIQDPASLDQVWLFWFWDLIVKQFDMKRHQFQAKWTLSEDGHSIPLKQLTPTYDNHHKNAQQRFIDFVLAKNDKVS